MLTGTYRAYTEVNTQKARHTVQKNTDKSLYLNSEKAKVCPFCKRTYKKMVSHMKTNHDEYEVFVSRISQEMADKVIHGTVRAIKHIKGKSLQYIKSLCLFCEEEKDFMPNYWNTHIRSHTGEYGKYL